MSLRVLHEIHRLVMMDLTHLILVDNITDQDLTEEEYSTFILKVSELIDSTTAKVELLKALDTTGNSSLDDAAILAVESSPM